MTPSSAPARTVLVLGANGRFGLAATQAFAAAGWRVLAHVRRDAAAGMPAGAELVRAPLEALGVALRSRPAAARSASSVSIATRIRPMTVVGRCGVGSSIRAGIDSP